MNLPKINLIILFNFFCCNTILLTIQPCKEFFLTKDQDYYTDQQNRYSITIKVGSDHCSDALSIEVYKKNNLVTCFLATPLAWNFRQSRGRHIKLDCREDGIAILDNNTKEINFLPISSYLRKNNYPPVFELVLSKNEQYAAAVTTKNVALYWDLQKQQEIFVKQDVTTVALSPDGTLLAADNKCGVIIIFDNKTKKISQTVLLNNFYTEIIGLEFSSDGKELFVVAMPSWKYYKNVVPCDDREIWDYIFEIRPQDLPVADCYYHLTIFRVKELLAERYHKIISNANDLGHAECSPQLCKANVS